MAAAVQTNVSDINVPSTVTDSEEA